MKLKNIVNEINGVNYSTVAKELHPELKKLITTIKQKYNINTKQALTVLEDLFKNASLAAF